MSLLDTQLVAIVAILLNMTIYYFVAMARKDVSIIDIGWATGFVFVAWATFFAADHQSFGLWLVTILVTLWGVRLALHILSRKRKTKEDWRYQKYRQEYGKDFWWKAYYRLFLGQGMLMFIVSASIILMAFNSPVYKFHWVVIPALAVWILGFVFEAVGDWQLNRFIKRKKASKSKKGPKFMTKGLWQYSRHPNYFGEIIQWWAIWFMVLPLEYGISGIMSPVLITFLILRVSGVPLLEEEFSKSSEYVAYKKKTNALIPWWPKK